MKKIIVPVDFSPCSENALINAIAIAQKLNRELILLHSFLVPIAFGEATTGSMVNEQVSLLEGEVNDQFESLKEKIKALSTVPYTISIIHGSLSEQIQKTIKEESVDLIVMGTKGAGGLQKALLGSNTYGIMKQVPCPVIALPEHADITQMKNMALAGDYLKTCKRETLAPLFELSKAFFAKIHIVHIDDGNGIDHDELETARQMEKYFKRIQHTYHYRIGNDVEKGLLDFAAEKHIDLTAIISRHHSFIERITKSSLTRKMTMDIPMPIMVLHEQ